ncbi:MAG: enoyl-CoA hydratase/isomerase family protein [Planctomycetota bacterium]|nr:enoyl-CoA hydratase/isomerase family protein [Planctomycetota bacterium]
MIDVTRDGRVAILRLDRPSKRNALTPAMLRALGGHLATSTSAGAIVLSGVGDVFCAGFDLALARDDAGELEALLRTLDAACRALRDMPCPVVASAHGAAIAGGCALLCACDVVVTEPGARIGYPAVRLGISPAVSAPHLGAGIGRGAARARLLDPALIDGREAARLGLAAECVDTRAACEPRAIELAHALAAKPPHALAYTKRWLNELEGAADARALDASLSCVGTPEQQTLLAAAFAPPTP